jgi:transglutaminase-like putative cysteine protease
MVARRASWHPIVRDVARAIVAEDPGRRGLGPACPLALREWLELHTRYLDDPRGVEYVTCPENLLSDQFLTSGRIAADCDDVAGLAAALALSVGLKARFLVIQFDGAAGFGHIRTAIAFPGGPWLDCDPTRPRALPRVSRCWALEV